MPSSRPWFTGLATALALAATGLATAEPLASVSARSATGGASASYDGVVEALRQTVIAAQVSGAVVQLDVKAGDRVKAGQLLLRIDARAAEQASAASDAQVRAAKAAAEVATKEYERQQRLQADNFISAAALDRARAEYQAALAQAQAQAAQAGAVRTQSGFYVVRAPYAGLVSEVAVTLGDMALPGRALVTLYDPAALRVTAPVPQSVATRVQGNAADAVRVELPGLPAAQQTQTPRRVEVLPAADAATHTQTVRAELAPGLAGALPGQFARLWLPGAAGERNGGIWVPASALVRRAEMSGVYVLDAQGRALLRQVRIGRRQGDEVELLSGVAAGERIATDPQAAARTR
jgi:multidrug efflux system membrane fusion protein